MTQTQMGQSIGEFFGVSHARLDRWQVLNGAAKAFAARRGDDSEARAALDAVRPVEEYFAYPGVGLVNLLEARLSDHDASGFARTVQRISAALLSKSYRYDRGAFETGDESEHFDVDRLRPTSGPDQGYRPYFEVLVVTPSPREHWPKIIAELRALRRIEDPIVAEPLCVGTFEDALLAVVLNGDIQSVILHDGFEFSSRLSTPGLRAYLTMHLQLTATELSPDAYSVKLATAIHALRPELDLFLLTDKNVEAMAGDDRLSVIRQIFYQVEEPLETYFAVLAGVTDRYQAPFFDNLKQYARRPIGTFHALPVARGKSIFNSNWARDMAEFYGANLFLAESSATTGGLDSLLEPTGNIKVAQEKAARAFGADRVFFVTNGTSTSNKMVHQGILRPGDIVLVDRNCHKSHHYGMVLSGAQPLYVEAYPMKAYSMYGGVPLRTMKRAMLDLKADGKLDRLRMVVLTNCTFDGHVYNPKRVMMELLAIKPDLVFLWDEAWFGFARFSPFYRSRTAMGARAAIRAELATPGYRDCFAAQTAQLGADFDPRDERLLGTPLIPDPDKVRLRVYQCHSTHKSMSALRQGSMVLVADDDYDSVEENFHEAVFTHASTSPNQQIIASLDVARRQMELEGYFMVGHAIEHALTLRREVNGHPLISKYFRILGNDDMVPPDYRQSGFVDFFSDATEWSTIAKAIRDDEFWLDPTRLTLVCGTAGFDGTQFKNLLANEYDIQVNKTSRNSILLQTNINNTRSDIAQLIKALLRISHKVESELGAGGAAERAIFDARVASLMTDVPDLPDFSSFADRFRDIPGSVTTEGNMRDAFFAAYRPEQCEHIPLFGEEIDTRLKDGPELIAANFVIPYPPGFPIMVPGQVITQETIDFMRKLDVKEIHGYDSHHGIKLLRPGVEAGPNRSRAK